ncbi:IS66 family insertion sequence element accessory protein TnpA [Salmonella enterica]|uniref:IS66 family insertion sequence element accessory protein TnpA n=1 Tax=Salmonella enterica TaxID=28901 RepID=UPI0020A5A825|nr:IS66 family insertion sequence element accessory protein TnpB [Salmonella enterica]
MSKHRWSIEQKRQHVAAWRASGLTRQQYCELEPVNDIPFKSLREWPKDVAKAECRANEPSILPVQIAPALQADAPPPATNGPVTTSRHRVS